MIEDNDPGQSSVHFYPTISLSRPKEVADLDVENFVDRLRFMGLDRDFVGKAIGDSEPMPAPVFAGLTGASMS